MDNISGGTGVKLYLFEMRLHLLDKQYYSCFQSMLPFYAFFPFLYNRSIPHLLRSPRGKEYNMNTVCVCVREEKTIIPREYCVVVNSTARLQ